MLLRASSEHAGLDVDLTSTVDDRSGDPTDDASVEDAIGVAHGRLLIDFAEAVVRASDNVDRLRSELLDRLGPEATGHAAATITAFSGLVRVADGTGIPIDDGLAAASVTIRDQLALEKLGGAANSRLDDVTKVDFTTVDALFDNSAR